MRSQSMWTAIAIAASCFSNVVLSKAVFAHYMVGTVYEAHVQTDIDDAMNMGLDGFALNIGDPTQSYVTDTVTYMFAYANTVGFKLYMSLDVYASGAACYAGSSSCNNFTDYETLLTDFLGNDAWYKGPNGLPMISTFSSGGVDNKTLPAWRNSFGDTMYFIPDFDETSGYYEGAVCWYQYWGDLVEGLFSWESAWPVVDSTDEGDMSKDVTCMAAATTHGKGYMIGLSILAMDPAPDFVQIMTWNDGPEAHYIGNLWLEQNNASQPGMYASEAGASHIALQSLLYSFISAWKAGGAGTSMDVVWDNTLPQAQLWYKTIFQDTECAYDGVQQYFSKPNGSDAGVDSLSWSIVVPQGQTGYSFSVISNSNQVYSAALDPGLNYGSVKNPDVEITAGAQTLVIYGPSGGIVAYTAPGRCMSESCLDGIYNYNPQVTGLVYGDTPDYSCWQVSGTIGIDLSLDTSWWAEMNTDSQFATWMSTYTPNVGLLYGFANPMGDGDAYADTGITDSPSNPTCSVLNDAGADAGSGWEYLVLTSINNVHTYLKHMNDAVLVAYDTFDGTQIALTSTFWPAAPDNLLLVKELLNGLGVVFAVLFAFVGAAVEGIVAGLVGGLSALVAGAISATLYTLSGSDATISSLSEIEKLAQTFLSAMETSLTDLNTGLIQGDGTYDGKSMTEIISGGYFVDFTTIPLLKDSGDFTTTTAGANNVYISCYAMTEDEFDNTVVVAGNDDYRLQLYYQGYGCYFQGLVVEEVALGPLQYAASQNPPGWGTLSDSSTVNALEFTARQIIQSSLDAHVIYGFNYNATTSTSLLEDIASAESLADVFVTPGLFTIPICMPNKDATPAFESRKVTFDIFIGDLDAPGSKTDYPSFCDCYGIKDAQGVSIEQIYTDMSGSHIKSHC